MSVPGPVVGGGRRESTSTRLRRAGFLEVARAETFLADAALARVLVDQDALLVALAPVADPDAALLALVRLAEAVAGRPEEDVLRSALAAADDARTRLLAVLGASVALGDELVRHPDVLADVLSDESPFGVAPSSVRAELLRAAGADPSAAVPVACGIVLDASSDEVQDAAAPADLADATDAMRRAYRRRLAHIAAWDLASAAPEDVLPAVAAALSYLAAAALEAALAIARAGLAGHGAGTRLAVVAMGKCGARELNYVSDVDVVHVAEPVEGVDETVALQDGARLAAALARVCAQPAGEPPLWTVDAALRPEGKDGPLVRTVASHRAYYERWAKTWEFQALLKARPVAGDVELGAAYLEAVSPFVWQAVTRENFVADAQAMRRRVEDHVPAAEADRQVKLGKGGLRDVEFTVQLLQLVHGRADASIRVATTLTALDALTAAGYVGRDDRDEMARCYRFLRVLEHRLQLHRLFRTHLLPTAEPDLRRLARSVGLRTEGAEGLLAAWRLTRQTVRAMHERLYYRPLLPAVARLSASEVSLRPEDARARLSAIGYRDPAGAARHIAALTEGVSRRSAIQRQLLPVMLGWFAEGADPDAGLLAFRVLSEELGSSHWYLKLLRDSGTAAHRLARLLAGSRYLADALARSPESVSWLGDDAELEPPGAERLSSEIDSVLTRADEVAFATQSVRALRRRELARTAAAEALGLVDVLGAADAVSGVTDVVLASALRIAHHVVRTEKRLDAPLADVLVIGMGRLGGRESGYGSDADVQFVHRAREGAAESDAHTYATAVASRLRTLLGEVGSEPSLEVDADLRPEGRNGPLVRSVASFAEYHARWSLVWEAQALLRARRVAGPEDLWDEVAAIVDPVRYPSDLPTDKAREVRRTKARVEAERMPRGTDPARNVKLGRGGLADVEWTVQLLQLEHAGRVPALRTTSTLGALDVLAAEGILEGADADVLREAWLLASSVRNANVLWSGRADGSAVDALPSARRDLEGVARLLGHDANDLDETYLRTARRCRAVVDRVFYGA
ncbi:bifunctional [glutamine synthetase] adenylyltransferase/[glutamine synthetase]-adenylyl-L-tyrosine phosphorylase [Sanguibacter sp. HDW7]|uniref:bifunctional [glutamine synthetase] adenylyltransferase/[glutamine synthetase]-adenylyl-L-tyrosine phosphorylase n=1 Tax=Sanguibacter sp. HDW7 TaxID=2714931 RepID=UPI00140A11BD|nr:bifunctional [glutamine synthetase] adenylyltransferase/[glutamine synthetase]-adenylyl-L-tyrosine phosphorylase [Sanguibacter sp. HDW7]QIK83733.1 bifunctional [glutamine synthetase] adenylyltransferase/[glutamine synthetase]-adenylyl-L-tyrosine phosphorylase [Sanguibacter sp. HDW7]